MNRTSSITWRLWLEMRPYLWHLVGLFLISLMATPLALLTPCRSRWRWIASSA